MYRKYGRVYGINGLTSASLVINDPDLIREVFVKRSTQFPDRVHWNFNNDYLDHFLILMSGGQKWKRIRTVLTPAFTSRKMKKLMTKMISIADKLVENIDSRDKSGE